MEANTVIISTEEYNRMRDINEGILHGKTVTVCSVFGVVSYTKEETVKNLYNTIRLLRMKIKNLENPKEKEIDANDLKNMSLFQLIKWKLKN